MKLLWWFLELVVDLLGRSPRTHALLLAPGFERLRWWLGRRRAQRTAVRAARRVPAYGAFLAERGASVRTFAALPETDKRSYIARWSIPERCVDGRLPRRGVVVDESSGSSGTPTSWVRGPVERRASRELLRVGFLRHATGDRPVFVINAFSLGAWATGMNVTAALTRVSTIKSTGPDRDKILATMREFGPGYTYVITSYPPFLKGLLDDDRLDWSRYDVVCAFGGEGISEGMRDHVLRRARQVVGAYGASDLEISIAVETEFTIALRRAIAADPALASALTRQDEYGVLPNIFQYNPYAYLVESNDAGELVVTVTRPQNIDPRIRYNIHDRGHVLRMRDVVPVLRRFGHRHVLDERVLDLPLLLQYGRSDQSVDHNGASSRPTACATRSLPTRSCSGPSRATGWCRTRTPPATASCTSPSSSRRAATCPTPPRPRTGCSPRCAGPTATSTTRSRPARRAPSSRSASTRTARGSSPATARG